MNDILQTKVTSSAQSSLSNPADLIQHAIDKNVTCEVLERLMDLKERYEKNLAEQEMRQALAKFQSECPIIPKNKVVLDKSGKVRYRYASLEEIVKIIQPLLYANGLSYTIDSNLITKDDIIIEATVRIEHVSGAYRESTFRVPIDKEAYMNEQQKFASALTYAKRYAFCNALGILTGDEDDDANTCNKEEKQEVQQPKKEKPKGDFEAMKKKINECLSYEEYEKIKSEANSYAWTIDEIKILKEMFKTKAELLQQYGGAK